MRFIALFTLILGMTFSVSHATADDVNDKKAIEAQ
jgi:hypothetical protein